MNKRKIGIVICVHLSMCVYLCLLYFSEENLWINTRFRKDASDYPH